MKLKLNLLSVAALAGCLLPALHAQQAPAPSTAQPTLPQQPDRVPTAPEKMIGNLNHIEIKNVQGEKLGRIRDISVDLASGRVIEVLVVSGDFLGMGGKTVSVPPLSLKLTANPAVYTLDASKESFASAPALDLSKWQETGQSERIAAAYRQFGQEPYFLTAGEKANSSDKFPKKSLGYVERASKINGMPLANPQGEDFGTIASLSLNVTQGRIRSVIVALPDDFFTGEKSAAVADMVSPDSFDVHCVVPAMALSFNSARDGLVIDNTRVQFAEQPRYTMTAAAFGNPATSKEESYEGPHTTVALEQGATEVDMERTALIKKNIRAAKLNDRRVQVGTMDGRVTLRGSTATDAEKVRIGDIAIAASRLELVDNQIVSRQRKTE